MVLGFGFLFIVVMIVVVMAMNFGIPFTAYSGSYGYERALLLNKLGLVADLTKQSFVHWLDDLRSRCRGIGGERSSYVIGSGASGSS